MSRFIETIRAENGIPQMISLHQQRVNRTLKAWGGSRTFNLSEVLMNLYVYPSCTMKIRIEYNIQGLIKVETFKYLVRQIRSVQMIDIGNRNYNCKFADREWINDLLAATSCDEIIMIKNGMVTDSSIANLTFFNGKDWLTPEKPLLAGTQRQFLLEQKLIKTAPITLNDVFNYTNFKLINAMLPWNESPILEMDILTP